MNPPETPVSPTADPAAELAALDREEQELMRLQLAWPAWLRDNPGLSLTMLYLFASVVGMVFHYLLLKRFGFNVLDFSETSDFLMVVAREPLTVALALLGVPFYVFYMKATTGVSRWAKKKAAWLHSTPEKRRKTLEGVRRWRTLIQVLFIGVWAFVFVQYYSLWRSRQIRAGEFRAVAVHFKTDSPRADGKLTAEGLALLGTTSRYVFLYDPATKQAEVAPLDSIARLVWDARTRRERQADAAK
jgi:hypothetical protein